MDCIEENNRTWFEFDQELIHIINKEGVFYAFNPNNSTSITDKNDNLIQINKLKLINQDDNCIIKIGIIEFHCDLLIRNTDHKVLLRVGYYDDEYNKFVHR